MLDLIGGPMQSAMSTTFTWLSLIATAFEVLYRLRGYLGRRAQRAVVKIKPARRRRAVARPAARKPSAVVDVVGDRRVHRWPPGLAPLLRILRQHILLAANPR